MILDIFAVLMAAFFVIMAASLLRFGFLLWRVPTAHIIKARKHSGDVGMKDVLTGNIDAYHNSGRKDFSISSGLAYDTKTTKAYLQGRLSDEIVDPLT